MKPPFVLPAIAMLIAATVLAVPQGIPIQYMDEHGRMPMTTDERLARQLDRGPYMRRVQFAPTGSRSQLVVLLVEHGISDGIQAALTTFQSDLENEGYSVEVWDIDGGTAADLRADLQAEYAGGDLVGAICIGDIPTGWIDGSYGEYPADLYLMDMNGTWTDSDNDGLFESYSNGEPEIWVGRLTPTYLTFGSSVELLNEYLAKDHAYRTGILALPDRALAYEEAFTGLTDAVDYLYDDVVRKSDPVATNADDFKAELMSGYEWVHLISHSSPWGSSFHTGAPPEGGGTLNNLEVPPLDPHAFFYVLNCCSNGRWTEMDNLANSYIWCDSYGLAALAQTRVDYTNYFQEYYQTLAAGSCLGEAFRVWLSANMYLEDGAVLLGDPTLKPRLGGACHYSFSAQQSQGTDSWQTCAISDDFHTQGRVDTYFDPSTGHIFAVCGTSYPVRANILSTVSDGDTWAPPVLVSDHEYWDWHPTVGGDGTGNVWTAWQSMDDNHEGYDIYVSSWNGTSWQDETILTSGDPFEVEPAMDGGGGHCWIVWQKWYQGTTTIEGAYWTGSQWSTVQEISGGEGAERNPDVARNGSGGFGLVYHARRDGNWVICFRDAPDSGPFGNETVISSPSSGGRYPDITSDGTQYWVAWQDDSGAIMVSHGSGSSWSTPETVSALQDCSRPTISASPDGDVMVMWTYGTTQLRCNLHSGGVWQGSYPAVTENSVDDASLAWDGQEVWAVYGRRDSDLHWNIWAATPDPEGIHGETWSTSGLGISICGRNPSSGSFSLNIASGAESVELRIFDMSGRCLLDRQVRPGPVTWNCMEQSGNTVPPGIYFAVVSDGEHCDSCRMIRL